ncbi:MAG: PIN domain-containing protein [Candidatus Sulfotelmatobacter sp.]
MVTYVLDSSAVLRYLHNQAGSERVAEILKEHLAGESEAIISASHWGEIAGITRKLYGQGEMDEVLSRLGAFGLRVIAADADRAVRAAMIKVGTGIPYVDSFGVELAEEANRVLVTADFDLKPVRRDISIEFLPAK